MKPETVVFSFCDPIVAGGFKQGIGADDVCFHELRRSIDRAVDVTLGCEVDDCVGTMSAKDPIKGCPVSDVHVLKGVAGRVGN